MLTTLLYHSFHMILLLCTLNEFLFILTVSTLAELSVRIWIMAPFQVKKKTVPVFIFLV
jgi:hypothetical protein